ncbi:sulfotransferase family protein [Thermomonospora umbrina]|uniref:Sulfotransferase family protein n=1 Tax=Thermomonospora umbrina TaxID=111806 RepID=A0A3D9SNN3_9ACTN|nr:sulfotransferase family protein [Thermomonospora umbrina]REE97586.1 hypothetical protein DFJ69_3059 [Thermomonospora umbrina]
MQVIGVGFGRTGTTSLRDALEILGFGPCHHMRDVMRVPDRVALWRAAARGEAVDWDEVFAGFRSTVDWPAAAFWRELVAHYPAAQVILTVRDPAKWYESAAATVFQGSIRAERQPARTAFKVVRAVDPQFGGFARMVNETVHQRVFGCRLSDRERVLAAYHRHLREVRAQVPGHRLLTYDVREGWAPLCAFLNVPTPDMPFPRANAAAAFGEGRPGPSIPRLLWEGLGARVTWRRPPR